jgi:signal transduction histidine kinase/ligand-binding sensor domain-containing protein
MWFGTEAGLARFDGRRTLVVNDPGLPSGRILALQTDSNGTLWVGTDNGGFRLTDGKFELIKETAGQTVSAIICPQPGLSLLATEQGQVFESRVIVKNAAGSSERDAERTAQPLVVVETRALLKQPLESVDRDHPGPLVITSLSWSDNTLLAGTLSRGVLQIENGLAREPATRPASYFVYALARTVDGALWAGTKTRKDAPGAFSGSGPAELKRIETNTGTVMSVRPIGEDVWIGTDGYGVFRFSQEKIEHLTFDGTAGGLRSDHVYAIYEDREGVIWFGTDRGVCRFDPHAPKLESLAEASASNFVRALYRSSAGPIFAGTNRGLFVSTDPKSWTPITELSRNIIYAIDEDKSGHLLVASASGFYVGAKFGSRIEDTTFTRVETASGNADAVGSIRAIAQFQGATYFAVFGRGIERIGGDRTSLVWSNSLGNSREVISLLADGDARLLIGTTKDGVLASDGKSIAAESPFPSLKGSTVRAMARTRDGTLWFGTGAGAYVCKADGQCTQIVPGVDVRYLVANENSGTPEILCGTRGNGLLRIQLDAVVGPIVAPLDSEQGLPSQSVFAALPIHTESLLIGTNRGIARYEPGTIPPTLFVSRLLSKRVHAPAELQGGLNLEYPQNSLLVDVTAVSSRTFPEQFQYAFMLIDGGGKLVKQRLSRESQFAMESLKPGKYTVTVRGFTKDLVASAPLSFSFIVAKAPFPWTSTALAILLALALLALLWAILERRRIVATSAALFTANRDLANARLNLANEAERERRRISRDLHDQTLADLRHLALMTDQIQRNGGPEGAPTMELRIEIESISQEVRRICEDLSPSVLQNVGFAAALEFALSHVVQDSQTGRKIEYEFSCDELLDERVHLSASEQMQLYRIVQEAVNNVWRHSGATQVKMFVAASPAGDFSLRLEDNGREFDLQQTNSSGRGLANMRARAALIDAQIGWAKRQGGGTVFSLEKKTSSVTPEQT